MSPRELAVAYSFSVEQAIKLQRALLEIRSNPYDSYRAFQREVAQIVAAGPVPSGFLECVQAASQCEGWDSPFNFIENAPVDLELPLFDNADPTASKRSSKRTFVVEGFLEIYAQVSRCPAIGFRKVNNGDVFHDIYPKSDLYNSQSQKSLGPFHFHKDLASYLVRPDFVNILAVRSFDGNQIWTTFVSNQEVLRALDAATRRVLECAVFCTNLGESTDAEGSPNPENSRRHAVIEDGRDLLFFETQTRGLTSEAEDALRSFVSVLHRCKRRLLMRPGDFVSISNNTSLHGKEVGEITDEVAMRERWSMKTVNVRNLEQHRAYLVSADLPVFDV